MIERRELPRIPLLYYLAVFDRETDSLIGYLADITPVGALVLSDTELEMGRDYLLKLERFSVFDGTETFEMNGRCLRSYFDPTLQFYKNGFQLTEISPDRMQQISTLIDTYRFIPDTEAK